MICDYCDKDVCYTCSNHRDTYFFCSRECALNWAKENS